MTELTQQVLAGDVRAASRLMRDIEDRIPEAMEVLKELYPHTGRAFIVGITGIPGAGKSTIADRLIDIFRKEGKTIGIVAVDPTSPFTGGAILGDRIRMQRHATDEAVFIRSVATRGSLGGLSRATHDIVHVMDAMGKDIILVETVGVGQDEVKIINTAHTCMVVLMPGMGDEIQAIKAGIIEIGDLFVINKCDREGADKLERELRMVLDMSRKRRDAWEPQIFKTEAVLGKGIVELAFGIYRHKQSLEQGEDFRKKVREKVKEAFLEVLETEAISYFTQKIEREGRWDTILNDLTEKRVDPYSLVERLMAEELTRSIDAAQPIGKPGRER
jgi:LAO/AO transport system kinase